MLQIHSPFDLNPITEIPLHTQENLESFLQDAETIFRNESRALQPYQRIKILENARELMKVRKEEIIETACKEGGKPLTDTIVEVDRAINGVDLCIHAIHNLKGNQIPMALTPSSAGRLAFSIREPIGIVAAISAFNHPVNLIIHQVFTAVAAGCPVIVKPSLQTPLSCLLLSEILLQAGLPEDFCQVLIAEDDLAEKLACDPRISFLTFIGSSKVGWYLRSKIAPGTRCALEHGGVAPVIVEDDAMVDEIIPPLIKGAFYHAGQVCVSVQKIFIHESLAEDFIQKFASRANQLIVGNQLDEKTEVGPLIHPKELQRVKIWVEEAVAEGAQLICGGKALSETCYAPTVLLNPSEKSKVSTLEIFGPVVCICSYSNVEEAVQKANSLTVHFQAAVFTNRLQEALKLVKKLDASTVMVNDHTAFRVDWMPFGGRDESGLGTGGIEQSIHDMTKEKLIVLKT